MSNDTDEAPNRAYHTAPADTIRVREVNARDADGDVEQFVIRMPITSTAEARDGEAFDRSKVDGFAEQIADGGMGIFIDHGRNAQTGSRYSALGKVGRLAEPEVVTRDGAADLDADFRFPMPGEVSEAAGTLREVLATLYSQAQAGIPLTSSIGWSEDTGDRDVPGGSDMLEASVVGIPSDPRTTTASAEPAALARAVSAASEGFDPDAFADAYRAAITQETVGEATPVAVDGHTPDTHASGTRNTVDVNGEEIDLTPPDRVQNAAALGLAKKEEYADDIGDCGTGTGEAMAQAIVNDDLTPEILLNGGAVADSSPSTYLESHESDLDVEGTPSEWDESDWTGGCAEVQQALWGFYADWFADTEAEIEAAMDDTEADAEHMVTHNLDDPQFSEGNAVMWSFDDTPVHGRVAGVHEEFTPPELDDPITGDEGEAVYSIHEWDDDAEAFETPPNVAKPESSLDESTMDLPAVTDDTTKAMSDDPESGSDPDTDRDEPSLRDMEQKMDEVREMCERMDKRMEEMHEEMMGSPDEENMDGEDDEDDEEDDDRASEPADSGEERTVTIDGDEHSVAELRDALEAARDDDSELSSQTTNRASDDDDAESDATDDTDFWHK